MEVIYCVCRKPLLMLGIPRGLSWSLEAKPCEEGNILTLHVDGVKDVELLRGNPINLFDYRIEVTNLLVNLPYPLCSDEYVDVSQFSSEIGYIEVGRKHMTVKKEEAVSKCSTVEIEDVQQEPCIGKNAFYKWSQIVSYLENRLGALAVSSWLDDASVLEFTEETLKVKVGSEFRCMVVQKRCLNYIQDALKELFNSNATIELSF